MHAEPVEQLTRVRLPQMAAPASAVVGRRGLIVDTSPPAKRLNRLDLPEPVAPASATTVREPVSAHRSVTRPTTARACSLADGSSSSPPMSSAERKASARSSTGAVDGPPS
nr:hypothetical protein [Ornithinimicrobium pratense]